MKKTATAVAVALAVALAGCGESKPSWEDELTAFLDEEFDQEGQSLDDTCLGLALFGIDEPEQIGALILAFDDSGELPSANTTVVEWAGAEGESLDDLPFTIPSDLTVGEMATFTGEYLLDKCGVSQ